MFPKCLENEDLILDFQPRGIGMDMCMCFVPACREITIEMRANITAFVNSEKEGKQIVQMLGGLAIVDHREYEPDWIQVKLGACKDHVHKLEKLHQLVSLDGHINLNRIHKAYEHEESLMIDPEMGKFMDLVLGCERYYVDKQDGEWWIFDNDGEGLVGGASTSQMLHLAYAKRDELF